MAEFERISALILHSHNGNTRSAPRGRLAALIDEIAPLSTQDSKSVHTGL